MKCKIDIIDFHQKIQTDIKINTSNNLNGSTISGNDLEECISKFAKSLKEKTGYIVSVNFDEGLKYKL